MSNYINSPWYRRATHRIGELVAEALIIIAVIGFFGFLALAFTGPLH